MATCFCVGNTHGLRASTSIRMQSGSVLYVCEYFVQLENEVYKHLWLLAEVRANVV